MGPWVGSHQVKDARFKLYAERFIVPNYERRAKARMLGDNPTPAKFFASRILWDESMATRAARYLQVGWRRRTMRMIGSSDVCGSSDASEQP
jgi:hypothetical protein